MPGGGARWCSRFSRLLHACAQEQRCLLAAVLLRREAAGLDRAAQRAALATLPQQAACGLGALAASWDAAHLVDPRGGSSSRGASHAQRKVLSVAGVRRSVWRTSGGTASAGGRGQARTPSTICFGCRPLLSAAPVSQALPTPSPLNPSYFQVDVAGVDTAKFDDAYFKAAEKKQRKQTEVRSGLGGWLAGWSCCWRWRWRWCWCLMLVLMLVLVLRPMTPAPTAAPHACLWFAPPSLCLRAGGLLPGEAGEGGAAR